MHICCLLKGLQNNADVKFENQLRNSAIHIADREVLYYLLKTETCCQKYAEDQVINDAETQQLNLQRIV